MTRAAIAQYPGELVGRVTDAITGQPVENVWVEVLGTGLTAVSDGRGAFRIRGLEPGGHTARFSRLGYETGLHVLEVRRGQPVWLTVRLGGSHATRSKTAVQRRRRNCWRDVPAWSSRGMVPQGSGP